MNSNIISIQVIGRKILLKMPKSEADLALIRTIPYARWNKQTFIWEIPHYPGNLEKLKGHFVSTSYQNLAINSIKFYFEKVLGGRRKLYFVERPREEKTLPVVCSEEEIQQILTSVVNIKHKAISSTIYSGGLRIGELINLPIKAIDSNRIQIRIERGKGKKDRYTILSKKILELLRIYFKEYTPHYYLFEGQGNTREKPLPYSERSIQAILGKAVMEAGIQKHITAYTLRHSFATHLLENGTDLRYIQSLLGYESSKTTEIYTHVTTKEFNQISSPSDKLDI